MGKVAPTVEFRPPTTDGGAESTLGRTIGQVAETHAPNQHYAEVPRPHQLGRFQIVRLLGQGAFGSVYLAKDPQLDRDVALKVPRHGALSDTESEQRFLREARSAGQLRHPNIVPVYDAGQIAGSHFIASGYIAGHTLRAEYTETGPFNWRTAAALIAKMACALHYAHTQGIVHRDVKPDNILLDGAGEPHLTDFGLARRSENEVLLTQEGTCMGTPAYMSPEQATGASRESDARSDLWSLGVVLYELLAGRRPFEGNLADVLLAIQRSEPPTLCSVNKYVPRDLETICHKCLAKRPADRYANCADLADDLTRLLGNEPIRARSVSVAERLWRWCQREPRLAVIGGVALALMVLILGVSVTFATYYRSTTEALTNSASKLSQEGRNLKQALTDLGTANQHTVRERRLAQRRLAENMLDAARQSCLAEQDVATGLLEFIGVVELAQEAEEADLERVARLEYSHWLPCTGELVHWFEPDTSMGRLSLGFQGRVVRFADQQVRWLDGQGHWKLLNSFGDDRVCYAALRPAHDQLIVVFETGEVSTYASETGSFLKRSNPIDSFDSASMQANSAKPESTCQPCFSRDGRLLALAGGQIACWIDLDSFASHFVETSEAIDWIAFTDDASRLFTCGKRTLNRWNTKTALAEGETLTQPLEAAASYLSCDGSTLAVQYPTRVLCLDTYSGQTLGEPIVTGSPLALLEFSPDGSHLLSIDITGTLRRWNASTGLAVGQPIQAVEPRQLFGRTRGHGWLHPSNEGKYVLTRCRDGSGLTLWDTSSAEFKCQIPCDVSSNVEVAFAPEGNRMALNGPAGTQVWNIPEGLSEDGLPPHPFGIRRIVMHPHQPVMATMGDEDRGTIRVWQIDEQARYEQVASIDTPSHWLSFSADGKSLVTQKNIWQSGASPSPAAGASGSTWVESWDWTTGKPDRAPIELDAIEELPTESNSRVTWNTLETFENFYLLAALVHKADAPGQPPKDLIALIDRDTGAPLWIRLLEPTTLASGPPVASPPNAPRTQQFVQPVQLSLVPDTKHVFISNRHGPVLLSLVDGQNALPPAWTKEIGMAKHLYDPQHGFIGAQNGNLEISVVPRNGIR